MLDVLNQMVFRTAFPFGYLLIFLGLLTMFVAGVVCLIRARWIIGAFLTIAPASYVALDCFVYASIDLNASALPEDIVGTWRYKNEIVEFRSDGSFSTQGGQAGRWSLIPGSVELNTGRAPSETWKVVRAGKSVRLLRKLTQVKDPDLWDGDLEFSKAR